MIKKYVRKQTEVEGLKYTGKNYKELEEFLQSKGEFTIVQAPKYMLHIHDDVNYQTVCVGDILYFFGGSNRLCTLPQDLFNDTWEEVKLTK